jgi:hypothetical protein
MDNGNPVDLDTLWQHLLSRDAAKVRAAFDLLNHEGKTAVLEHLNRMAEEPNWHPEQRRSAKSALHALENETGRAGSRNG